MVLRKLHSVCDEKATNYACVGKRFFAPLAIAHAAPPMTALKYCSGQHFAGMNLRIFKRVNVPK
jgi:hypothetical protein